jgi:hypothetical protein
VTSLHDYRGIQYKASKEEYTVSPTMELRSAFLSETEDESGDSTQSDSSEDDNDMRWHEMAKGQDIPSEYWHIQKLIKYMKVGNFFFILILGSGLPCF